MWEEPALNYLRMTSCSAGCALHLTFLPQPTGDSCLGSLCRWHSGGVVVVYGVVSG